MKRDEDTPAFDAAAEPVAPAAAATRAPSTAALVPRRRLRAWGLGLAAVSLALAVLGFVAATSLLDGLQGVAQDLHIHIDGQEWGGVEAAAGPAGLLALGVVAALGLIALPILLLLSLVLVAAVLVPVGLVVMGAVGVVVAVGACVLLVGAVVLSPLWLAVLMLWWLLRRGDPVAAKSSAAPVAG